MTEKKLDTAPTLAEFLQCSTAKIRKNTRKGMPCVRVGRAVRYDREEILAWLRSQYSESLENAIKR